MGDQSSSTQGRTFTTKSPIKACRLRPGDLTRLYKIIHERQVEYSQTILSQLAQQPSESPAQFRERRDRVANSFTTTVNITGSNNEVVTGSGENFLSTGNIPEKILTIYFTTTAGPSSIGIKPLDSTATLLLDFSRPTVLDFSKPPTFATENTSFFEVSSSSESWFTALNTRLAQFFADRSTNFDWIHKPGIYDLFLLTIGLPFSLWIDYRLSPSIERLNLPTVLRGGIYVYCFFLGLFVFRGLFSYSRWVFPKIEIHSENSLPLRHRAVWAAIMIGVFGGAVWDAIKGM
jgi:hypothetical protein